MTVAVRAAGGVAWRCTGDAVEVVLVHRPRYDDWSLPKGKLRRGEHPLAGAVREVVEETGVLVIPLVRLPSTRYLTSEPGVEKTVDYWAMRTVGEVAREAVDEVDDVRWFPLAGAAEMLTYAHDRRVLAAFRELPAVTATVVVIRHGRAGKRGAWPGPDVERPLDAAGKAEAAALTRLLMVLRPARVVSATPVRCVQTAQPLAAALSLPLEIDAQFDEGSDPLKAAGALRGLAAGTLPGRGAGTLPGRGEPAGTPGPSSDCGPPVVCSQGKLIPPMLAALSGSADLRRFATPKGTGWLLALAGDSLVGTDPLVPTPESIAGR